MRGGPVLSPDDELTGTGPVRLRDGMPTATALAYTPLWRARQGPVLRILL